MAPFFQQMAAIRWKLMYCCYELSSVAEVRAANERLYSCLWVRVVISREDAQKIGY